jgi:small-conductance mechanosensitive channel
MNPEDYMFNDTLALALQDSYLSFVTFLPRLFWALIILLLGLLLAKWARSLAVSALSAIDLDTYFRRSKFTKIIHENELGPTVTQVIGDLVKWLIIYLFLISVFSILGLTSIANFMSNLLSYAPDVLAAALIFIIAVLLAGVVEGFVKNSVSNLDPVTGRFMGKIASYTVVVIGSLIALSELGIAELFINILFIGFVATLSVAVGLAIGLGSKDVVAKILNEWYKKYTKSHAKK